MGAWVVVLLLWLWGQKGAQHLVRWSAAALLYQLLNRPCSPAKQGRCMCLALGAASAETRQWLELLLMREQEHEKEQRIDTAHPHSCQQDFESVPVDLLLC